MISENPWARLTPYEIGIPGREFAGRVFGGIRDEAEARGSDLTDPGAFILLGEVGRAIREIQGEERGGDAIHRFGAFLFQAFHFHVAGEMLYLLETDAARNLVEWSFESCKWDGGELPADAGYLQFPHHLFWSAPGASDHAEPLDGVFWARSSGGTLSLLTALGVRTNRPGISLTELPPVVLRDAQTWLTKPVRSEGADFSNTLPGGDLGGLYSVGTLGEVLKLVGRSFAYLAGVPEALGPEETGPRSGEFEVGSVSARPSLLPFRRIRLVGESRKEFDASPEHDP